MLVNGKKPIFNDILAFIWNKMSCSPQEPLIKAAKGFYKEEPIKTARDILFESIPSETRRHMARKPEEILASMYKVFQELPSDHDMIFLALNLNNMPCVNLASIDGASLVYQQSRMNESLSEIRQENKTLREELVALRELIRGLGPSLVRSIPDTTPIASNGAEPPMRNQRNEAASNNASRSGGGDPPGGNPRRTGLNDRRNNNRPTPQPAAPSNSNIPLSSGSQQSQERENDWQIVQHKRRRRRSNLITGCKTGNELGVVPKIQKCRAFVSRLSPSITAEKVKEFASEIIGSTCDVEKLQTKFTSYSSFCISCEVQYREIICGPEHVGIRPANPTFLWFFIAC